MSMKFKGGFEVKVVGKNESIPTAEVMAAFFRCIFVIGYNIRNLNTRNISINTQNVTGQIFKELFDKAETTDFFVDWLSDGVIELTIFLQVPIE